MSRSRALQGVPLFFKFSKDLLRNRADGERLIHEVPAENFGFKSRPLRMPFRRDSAGLRPSLSRAARGGPCHHRQPTTFGRSDFFAVSSSLEQARLVRTDKKAQRICAGLPLVAERTRFELVVRNDPYVGLANRWFQPLTHLSSHCWRVRMDPEFQVGLQIYEII